MWPTETIWDPMTIFCNSVNHNHAIVILNRPIHLNSDMLFNLWKTAKCRVTVDGGTDRWFEYLRQKTGYVLPNICKNYLPDIISGDFDSISPTTIKQLQQMNLNIIHTPDQNETDYTKALQQLREFCIKEDMHLKSIFVISEVTGRFDHIIGNINTLYKCRTFLTDEQVIHISKECLVWLLPAGKHKIFIPETLITNKSWCGLLPFESSVNCISTTGLKWNLDNQCLKYGGLISTSNTFSSSNEVIVTTDTSVVWTMGIESLFKGEDMISRL